MGGGTRAREHEQLLACVGAMELTLWVSLLKLMSVCECVCGGGQKMAEKLHSPAALQCVYH